MLSLGNQKYKWQHTVRMTWRVTRESLHSDANLILGAVLSGSPLWNDEGHLSFHCLSQTHDWHLSQAFCFVLMHDFLHAFLWLAGNNSGKNSVSLRKDIFYLIPLKSCIFLATSDLIVHINQCSHSWNMSNYNSSPLNFKYLISLPEKMKVCSGTWLLYH